MKKIFSILFLCFFTFINSLFPQWSEQTSGVTVQLTSVSCLQNQFPYSVWICGYSGTVLKTTNAGVNWINVSGNGIPNTISLINILVVDNNIALTAGYSGTTTYVYRTTNAGANWAQVFTQANGFIDAIGKITSPNLFMCGDPVPAGGRWSLWKSTNSGVNWDSTGLILPAANSTEAGWNNAMFCNDSKVWIGTNNSKIYYSSNSGTNWTAQSTGSEMNSYAVWFGAPMSPLDGFTGGTNTFLRTTNGGINWVAGTFPGTGNFSGFAGNAIFVDYTNWLGISFCIRSDNKIYGALNGSNWSVTYTAPAGTYRHIKEASPNGPFWAVRNNGGISYHPFWTGINKINNEIPANFILNQNYPNPFNPSTAIQFDLPKSSFVKLIVYNSLGSEVAKLVNENLPAGSYEYKWIAPDKLSSGIYYFRLESDKGFRETKKMILIK